MAIARGFDSLASIERESTWDTAPAGTTYILPLINESMVYDRGTVEHPYLRGQVSRAANTLGQTKVGGTLTSRLTYGASGAALYSAVPLLTAGAFGQETTTQVGAGSYYEHLWTPADTLGESYSVYVDRKASRGTGPAWRYTGCKLARAAWRGEMSLDGGVVEMEAELVGGSGNSNLALPTTNEEPFVYATLDQAVFRIAAATGALGSVGTVSTNDVLGIAGFEVELQNNLAAEDYVTGSGIIKEPARGGFADPVLRITLARYEDTTGADVAELRTAFEAGTQLQADLVFTTGSYEVAFYFPNIRLAAPFNPNYGGPDVPRVDLEFVCATNDTDTPGGRNTNMSIGEVPTSLTSAIAMRYVDQRSVSYLA